MFASILIGIIVLLLFYLRYFHDPRVRKLINQIPGPAPLPLLGNALQMRAGHPWYLQLMNWGKEYREHGIVRVWLANKPLVAIFRPDYIETILSSSKHINKASEYDYLHVWLGTGLLTSTGDKWRHRRRMLTPTFHFNILNDFLPVFNRKSEILMKKLHVKAKEQDPINIFQDIALCALDIIAETAMGKDINCQSADSDYVNAVYRMSSLLDSRMRKPWYWSDFMYHLIGPGKEHDRMLKILHDFTNSVIADRLKHFDQKKAELVGRELRGEGTDENNIKKKISLAFLDMLLFMSENLTKLNMEDIREEVDTFMFEGHDTTAAAMNWAVHLVGANPDVQAKLHNELDRVLGKEERDITKDDLAELKYLDCCIKEALRLYPSVPIFGRSITNDLDIGPYTIPKNSTVLVMTAASQRDPQFFPDPDAFKPERFMDLSKRRHPYSFVPFSAGPRNCIGQKFAMMEEKTVLARFFQNFSVKSYQNRDELYPVADLILRPEKGITVKLTSRK